MPEAIQAGGVGAGAHWSALEAYPYVPPPPEEKKDEKAAQVARADASAPADKTDILARAQLTKRARKA